MRKKADNQVLREDKKVLPVELPKATHQRLRILAAQIDTSMNELCREGIEYIFKKYETK